MRKSHFALVAAALLTAGTLAAQAQKQPSPIAGPYKAIAITPPASMTDANFESFRKQLGEVAQRKDRAALERLVVAQGFFWDREGRNSADKRKSGIDNLATALGLSNKDGVGWEILFSYADDPTASASPNHKGAFCAPGEPAYSTAEFAELLKTTQSVVSEWGYPVSAGIEVHATAQANAPVIDKLGLIFVRVAPETTPTSAAYLRIVTPGGKAGYVSVDTIGPLGNDQLCYVNDSGAWKIGGFIGGGEPQ